MIITFFFLKSSEINSNFGFKNYFQNHILSPQFQGTYLEVKEKKLYLVIAQKWNPNFEENTIIYLSGGRLVSYGVAIRMTKTEIFTEAARLYY